MFSMQQFLFLLLAAVPYIALLIYLLITKRIKDLSISYLFLGAVGIVLSFGVGIVALLVIIGAYPQTNSSLSEGFLTGVFAAMMAVALLAGEFFRYLILKPSSGEEKPYLCGLSYGIGFSLGEYVFFLIMKFMNSDYSITFDMSLMLLIDIVIQLGISFVAYELIKQNNFASFAVGGLYYLSLFLLVALNSSIILNISAKVLVLIVTGALFFAYLPTRNQRV